MSMYAYFIRHYTNYYDLVEHKKGVFSSLFTSIRLLYIQIQRFKFFSLYLV